MNPWTKQQVVAAFSTTCLPALAVWELPNSYFPYRAGEDPETTRDNAVYRATRPSWLVKTAAGLIQLDLRKNVMSINWSDTGLRVSPGAEDDVTKGEFMIHAWTDAKVLEYLGEVAKAFKDERALP